MKVAVVALWTASAATRKITISRLKAESVDHFTLTSQAVRKSVAFNSLYVLRRYGTVAPCTLSEAAPLRMSIKSAREEVKVKKSVKSSKKMQPETIKHQLRFF